MKERRPIPPNVRVKLLVANRHTCCICNEPRHPVEIHHINDDPSNNAWNNLAVVCRNCHGLITAKSNLGSNYTADEVLSFKQQWEKRCTEGNDEEIETPVQPIYETKRILADDHEPYQFDMEEGDELVFSVYADGDLDLAICSQKAFDEWVGSGVEGDEDEEEEDNEDWEDEEEDEDDENQDDEDEHPLPDSYWLSTNVLKIDGTFTAPEAGHYVFLLINWNKEEAVKVSVDAAVWPAEE